MPLFFPLPTAGEGTVRGRLCRDRPPCLSKQGACGRGWGEGAFSPSCHPRPDRGSRVFVFCRDRPPCLSKHGACGRGCAPVPNPMWGRGLSERSEFRSPNLRHWGKGPRRATPGRPWFWVLLPKQKDLVVRGRNPAKPSLPPVILDISNPGSRVVVFGSRSLPLLAFHRNLA